MAPKIIGILNITPDSFSDGGKYNNVENAIKHTKQMICDGADIIDIGAESTRNLIQPHEKEHNLIQQQTPITLAGHELEWQRLEPILPEIISLTRKHKVQISVDTRNIETITKLLDYDIDIINDVTGLDNPQIANILATTNHKIIVMHNLGVPANPKITLSDNDDEIDLIYRWFDNKLNYLHNKNISKERIILDPGISFGKTAKQGINIIKNINKFKKLGCELLVGHSRKSIFNLFSDAPRSMRDPETYAASIYLAKQQVDYLRVHDVSGNIRAIKVSEGLY